MCCGSVGRSPWSLCVKVRSRIESDVFCELKESVLEIKNERRD